MTQRCQYFEGLGERSVAKSIGRRWEWVILFVAVEWEQFTLAGNQAEMI